MVTESAHQFARIAVVVGMTPVGRVEAQLSALVRRADLLVDRVDRLEDASAQLLELAQLDRLVDTVVLQVLVVHGGRLGFAVLVDRLERFVASAGHRQTVHVRELAIVGAIIVVG